MHIPDLWTWYDHGLINHHREYLHLVSKSYAQKDVSFRVRIYDTFVETNFMIARNGYKHVYKCVIHHALRKWWLAYKYTRMWKIRVRESKQKCVNTHDLCLSPIGQKVIYVKDGNALYGFSCADINSIMMHSICAISETRQFKVVNPYTQRTLEACEIWNLYVSLRLHCETVLWIFDELVRADLDWLCIEYKFKSYFEWIYRGKRLQSLSEKEYMKKWNRFFEFVADRFFPWDHADCTIHINSIPKDALARESRLLNMFQSYGHTTYDVPNDLYLRMLSIFLKLWSVYPKLVSFT